MSSENDEGPPREDRRALQTRNNQMQSVYNANGAAGKPAATQIDGRNRYTAQRRCPVCDGYPQLPQGHGTRCWGYLSSDELYAYCTREAYADGLQETPGTAAFAHRLNGSCNCGRTHGAAVTAIGPVPREQVRVPVARSHPAVAQEPREIVSQKSHLYHDAAGALLAVHQRIDYSDGSKSLPWLTADGQPYRGLRLETLPIYNLPAIFAAEPGEPIYFVEGEKAADALIVQGVYAVTTGGGADQDKFGACLEPLAGRTVFTLSDNDAKGAAYMRRIGEHLAALGCTVVPVTLPGLPAKGDVYDWLAVGNTVEELTTLSLKALERYEAGEVDSAESADSAVEAEPNGWPLPVPLDDVNLPPFPVHTLSPWLREQVDAVTTATQTPADLAAMLSLSVIAAAAAGRCEVRPRPSWVEPCNIFTMTALGPANRTSAVFETMTEPVAAYEEARARDEEGAIAEAATERRILEATLTKLEADAAKAKEPEERGRLKDEAGEMAGRLAAFKVPVSPKLVLEDVTTERIVTVAAEQGGRIAILAPEADILDILGGRYTSGTPNFGAILKGHAGDTIRVDRMGRPSVYIAKPAITFGLRVQPDVLVGLAGTPGFRGRGLLGRFLYALPESLIGHRQIGAPAIPPSVSAEYGRNLTALLRLPSGTDEEGEPRPHVLQFDAEAESTLMQFEEWLEPQLAGFDGLAAMTDWAGKLAGAVVRIAGLLHLADHADMSAPWTLPIGSDVVKRATGIGHYLIPHAQAAFSLMGADPETEKARAVLRWLERTTTTQFSKRDAFNALRAHFKKADEVDRALSLLADRYYIRPITPDPEESRGPGRKPSPFYEVNPWVHAHNTHFTQNHPAEPNSAYSAYSALGEVA